MIYISGFDPSGPVLEGFTTVGRAQPSLSDKEGSQEALIKMVFSESTNFSQAWKMITM